MTSITKKTKSNTAIILTLLIFLSLHVFMLSRCIHIIRDIDQAECVHASLISFIMNQSSAEDIANLLLTNFDKGANLAGILPFSLLYAVVACISGISYISLKLTPLLLHASTFILLSLIIKKYFSLKSLLLFCLFYIFAPLFMYKWNLTFWAAHPESSFFSALILYLAVSNVRPLTLGLTAGLSLYISFFCLPVIMAVLICKSLYNRNNMQIFLSRFIPAFIFGFLPWLMFRYTYQKPLGPDEAGLIFLMPNFNNIATRFITALFNAPFFGPVFTQKFTSAAIIAKYIQHLFFLSLIILSLPKLIKIFDFDNKQKEIIRTTAVTIGLYFMAVIFSSHNQDIYNIASHAPRYFTALFPFFFLTAAVAAPKMTKKHKVLHLPAVLAVAIYLTVNIYDYKTFISLGQKDAYKTYKGLKYYSCGINSVEIKKAHYINKSMELLQKTPYLSGFSQVFHKKSAARYKTLPYYRENIKTQKEIIKDLRSEQNEALTNITRNQFMEGFGYGLVIRHDWNRESTMNFIYKYGKAKDRLSLKKGAESAFEHKHLYK